MYIEKVKQLKYLIDMAHNIENFSYDEEQVKIFLIIGDDLGIVIYKKDEINKAIEHVKNILYAEIENSEESVSYRDEYEYLKRERITV